MPDKIPPLKIAQDKLQRARNLRTAKIRDSDQLTHELGVLVGHIADLEDIVAALKEALPDAP